MPEQLCNLMVFLSFIFILPVYISLILSIVVDGVNVIHIFVIAGMFLPAALSVVESLTCAALYLLYLPYFLVMIIFFLVFMPSYAFARLYDTR